MQVKGGHRGTSGKQEKEKKRKLEDGEESDNKRAKTEENEVEGTGESVKQEEPEPEPVIVSEPAQTLETELQGSTTPTVNQIRPPQRKKVVEGGKVLARVMPEVRGHTSYLTFAVLLPALPSEEKSVQRETANGELVGQIDEQVESEDVKMMEA